MDDRASRLTSLDRVCLIVLAVIFYLLIRLLQTVQEDIGQIARDYEQLDKRTLELSSRLEQLEGTTE